MRKKRGKLLQIFETANGALRRKRTVAAVYILLRFLVIVTLVPNFSTGTMRAFFCVC